ncbi:UNVERIFIED_ORG: V8-like Glu-specific endopeptidase [Rhizobium esperanzae]|nr:peptidase S1 and S6, chymotrypsin/Hap [Rhizobium etli CNPAF512]
MPASLRIPTNFFGIVFLAISLLVTSSAHADPLVQLQGLYKDAIVFLAVSYETPVGKGCKYGTGFLISSSGYVVTSRHLITDKDDTKFEKYDIAGSIGEAFQCDRPRGIVRDLIFVHEEVDQDVLLLKIASEDVNNYVRACQQTAVLPGEKLYTIGFPLAGPLTATEVTRGSTSGPVGRWQITGSLFEGNSGSPVLNESGRLVGLVYGGYNGAAAFNYMVPLDHFKQLFGFAGASLEPCTTAAGAYLESECAPVQKDERVAWTLAEHDGLKSSSRSFDKTVLADDGYIILSYEWRASSSNFASGVNVSLSEDRKRVKLDTRLSSGPIFDQWKGYLSGILATTQIPERCK